MKDLKGKVAVVTGGNGVLGGAIAMGLARQGVKIAILGRNPDTVASRVKEITNEGGEAIAVPADVLNRDELIEAKEKINNNFGEINILVNAAGGNLPGAVITPDQSFFDLNMNDLGKVGELNFQGTVLPSLVFAQDMVVSGKGSI